MIPKILLKKYFGARLPYFLKDLANFFQSMEWLDYNDSLVIRGEILFGFDVIEN
jgi:hypothetical protein